MTFKEACENLLKLSVAISKKYDEEITIATYPGGVGFLGNMNASIGIYEPLDEVHFEQKNSTREVLKKINLLKLYRESEGM